ncbi:MAG TPA: UDP-N-acetylmuramoyl-tripeptide--D-alanyl-D-alanine ligase [Armatimonadota bacterium]
MESLLVEEVLKAVNGRLLRGNLDDTISGVSTDTRSLNCGDLFFALNGQHDGHAFVGTAIEKGAAGIVVSRLDSVPSECGAAVIQVDDPLWALGDLAAYYRGKFDAKVIAITGSVGKTTTKEMLAEILGRKWRVLKNELNYNNEIGVPMTLFRLERNHEMVVLELAMRGLGEIRRLAKISKPSIGVITNVGMSHIERLGSQGTIAEAKGELLAELPGDGLAVLNYEDGYFTVMQESHAGKIVSFGSCAGADIVATKIHAKKDGSHQFTLKADGDSVQVKLPILGFHNVFNALAAAAVAVSLGVDLATIREGLESFQLPGMRMELVKTESGCTVLNDAYNASPASMSAAVRTLRAMKGYSRKIVVLGDMLELGDYSEKAHRDIGVVVAEGGLDLLVTVGDSAHSIADGARDAGFNAALVLSYSDSAEAGPALKSRLGTGDVVLIKGSRGMKMELIVEALQSA